MPFPQAQAARKSRGLLRVSTKHRVHGSDVQGGGAPILEPDGHIYFLVSWASYCSTICILSFLVHNMSIVVISFSFP